MSLKNTNRNNKIVVEKQIEEVDDLMNPEDAVLLSSICAPGTESFIIKKNFIDNDLQFKKFECEDLTLFNSLELASNINCDVRLFSRKINTIHVSYVEPNKLNSC